MKEDTRGADTRRMVSRSTSLKMDRRSLVLRGGGTLAAAAVASSFPAPWVRAAKPVKIGYASPQTGPLAPFAAADDFIVGSAREVFKKQNLPIETIVKDSQKNSNRAAEVAADLILKNKVALMVVGAAPEPTIRSPTNASSTKFPAYQPCRRGSHGFLRAEASPTNRSSGPTIFLGLRRRDRNDPRHVVAAAVEDKSRGRRRFCQRSGRQCLGRRRARFAAPLAKNGYKLVHPPHFQTLTDNFSAQISAFKEAGVEIITGNMIPPDFTTFWTQARQQGLRPKICTITKALLFPSSVESVGQTANNLSTEVWWTPTFPFKSSLTGQSAAEVAAAYTQATGKQWTQPIGFVHSLFEVAADILKRSGDSQDPAANLDALLKTNLDTIVGPISWGKDR